MTTQKASTARSNRRWFQFSLRTLLLLPVLCSFACWWYVQYRSFAKARDAYERTHTEYQVQWATALDVCAASAELCEAEEQMPFADSVRARALHFARVQEIEWQVRAAIPVTLFGEDGREAAIKELDELIDYRIEAKYQLDTALGR